MRCTFLGASLGFLAGGVSAQQGEWSEWLDRDDPSGIGDDESLESLRNDGLIPCSLPVRIECRTDNTTGACFMGHTKYEPLDGVPGFPGEDPVTIEDDPYACQTRCVASEGCAFFTYYPDGSCHVTNEDAVREDDDGTSGSAMDSAPMTGPHICAPGQSVPWDKAPSDTDYMPSGQILVTGCTVDGGLVCTNVDNPRLVVDHSAAVPLIAGATPRRVTCLDYQVRYFCPAEDECTTYGGVKHPTEPLCCAQECAGYCGAQECSRGPGGSLGLGRPDLCCASVIKTLGNTCGSQTEWPENIHSTAPCILATPNEYGRNDCDPCVCDLDGIVNGINTARPGCAMHDPNFPYGLCSVTTGCKSMGAVESQQFPGTKWRPCEPGVDPEVDSFCPVVQGIWTTLVNSCLVEEGSYNRIPVVGPEHSSNTSFVVEHSYGAVLGTRLRDAWLQCDCDASDSTLDEGDPNHEVRPNGRFGTYTDPVGRPDWQTCKHRFYGDEWNVTSHPLDPMHTELVVRRLDRDEGWAYDGLRVEYTVCGQGATGEVKQGQGLWRPTKGFMKGAEAAEALSACRFYRTTECSPDGPREPALDMACTAQIREGWSGYCQCSDSRQTYHVGCELHPPFTCYDACRVPEDWNCDPWFYDNGVCDVNCGASDPDCSRDVTVPWGRLADPKPGGDFSYNGQGTRRHRDKRGWW